MEKLNCLKLNQDVIEWFETYVEKHKPLSEAFQSKLESFAAASVADSSQLDSYLWIAHTINQVYKTFGYRYIGRVELMKAYALQAVTQAVIAMPTTDDFSVRYSIPQKINRLTNDITKKLERNFRELSFAEPDYTRELHRDLKLLCAVLESATNFYIKSVFAARGEFEETGKALPFSLNLSSNIESQIKENKTRLLRCKRLLTLSFERLKALGEIVKLHTLAESSHATTDLLKTAADYIKEPHAATKVEERAQIASAQVRDKAFLIKLKQGIECRAQDGAWGVSLQWLHGRKEVEVAGNNYRVPRRVLEQYKLINDLIEKEAKEHANWSEAKAQVLDIGVKYQASFWSSSKSQAYFTLFKAPSGGVGDKLEGRVLSSFAPQA